MNRKQRQSARTGRALDAYNRHAGLHQDQYKTGKQERLAAQSEIEEALEDLELERLALEDLYADY